MVRRADEKQAEKSSQRAASTVNGRPAEAPVDLRERVVFLECRCEQLSAANEIAKAELKDARKSLAAAEQRKAASASQQHAIQALLDEKIRVLSDQSRRLSESEALRMAIEARQKLSEEELQTQVRSARVELEQRQRDVAMLSSKLEDARTRIETLDRSHERLYAKLFEWHSLVQAGTPDAIDLAEFIAELRAEVLSLERLLARSEARERALAAMIGAAGVDSVLAAESSAANLPTHDAPAPAAVPPDIPAAGACTLAAGAYTLAAGVCTPGDVATILAAVPRPSDRVLVERFINELTAPTVNGLESSRLRAGSRLVELAGPVAAPCVASAASSTLDPGARAQLVRVLGKAADVQVLPVAARFLSDPEPEVRIAALDACAKLAGTQSSERLELVERGLHDPDARVRRRALVHLSAVRGLDPGPRCASLLTDPDPLTRRLACITLAGTHDLEAALAVLDALFDTDEQVCRAASVAVEQIFGQSVSALLKIPYDKRREIVARLRAYFSASRERLAPQGRLQPAEMLAPVLPSLLASEFFTEQPPSNVQPTFEAIGEVLQESLSGCTPETIARELGCDLSNISNLVREYVRAGLLLRRGEKLFLP
jgi:hypothetical protein